MDPRFAPSSRRRARASRRSSATSRASFGEYGAHIDASPERLQELEERLASIERLKRKYGPSLADVLGAPSSDARRNWRRSTRPPSGSPSWPALVAAAAERYLDLAGALSAARRRSAPGVLPRARRGTGGARHGAHALRGALRRPGAARGAAGRAAAPTSSQFYVSPNPGEDLRPLAKVVSGGELSRVMLALKTLATTDSPGKTLRLRRGGRRDRRASGGRRRAAPPGPRAGVPGAVHHAPARRLRRAATAHLPGLEVRAEGPDADDGRGAGRRGPGRRTGPHDGRARGDRRARARAPGRCCDARRGESETGRKAKGESESRWRSATSSRRSAAR